MLTEEEMQLHMDMKKKLDARVRELIGEGDQGQIVLQLAISVAVLEQQIEQIVAATVNLQMECPR